MYYYTNLLYIIRYIFWRVRQSAPVLTENKAYVAGQRGGDKHVYYTDYGEKPISVVSVGHEYDYIPDAKEAWQPSTQPSKQSEYHTLNVHNADNTTPTYQQLQ